MTSESVLASTCLPFLFQAVEIKGEHYWDGGYIGNPAIFPLIYESQSRDVVIIHVDPLVRDECPTTTFEIMNRVNEVSFNSSLMREMRAVAYVTRLIETGKITDERVKQIFMHAIRADAVTSQLGALSKGETNWEFLRACCLRRDARRRANGSTAIFKRSGGNRRSILNRLSLIAVESLANLGRWLLRPVQFIRSQDMKLKCPSRSIDVRWRP